MEGRVLREVMEGAEKAEERSAQGGQEHEGAVHRGRGMEAVGEIGREMFQESRMKLERLMPGLVT